MKKLTAVRLEEDVIQRITEMAGREGRTVSGQIVWLLGLGLDRSNSGQVAKSGVKVSRVEVAKVAVPSRVSNAVEDTCPRCRVPLVPTKKFPNSRVECPSCKEDYPRKVRL
jgi:hypothetical protein